MAEIILAKTAGFCFGVANAVETAFQVLKENPGKTRIYGELIHNRQVSDALAEKGAFSIQSPDQLEPGDHVVIRAHGIGEDLYNEIKSKDVVIHDATCPYVRKIHRLVREKHDEGCRIVIAGDREHPEVIGVNGWCGNEAFIVSEPEEVELLPDTDECMFVVAQTTMKPEKYREICDALKKKFANVIKSDTICNATEKRQREALEISRKSDVMIVIGGRNSSNTRKLFEICSENCQRAYKVETAADIPPLNNNINTVGITAGASTPDWVIKEVIKKMEEMLNRQETENEISFEKAFEESEVNSIRAGEVVKGRIIGYNTSEVFVDLGYKADGTI